MTRLDEVRDAVVREAPLAAAEELIVIAEMVTHRELLICTGHVGAWLGFARIGTRGWCWARSTPYGISLRGAWPPPSSECAP